MCVLAHGPDVLTSSAIPRFALQVVDHVLSQLFVLSRVRYTFCRSAIAF